MHVVIVVIRWSKLNSQFTCNYHNIFTDSIQCNIYFITKVCYSHLAAESSYTMCNSQPTIPSSDLSCKDNNFLRRTISEWFNSNLDSTWIIFKKHLNSNYITIIVVFLTLARLSAPVSPMWLLVRASESKVRFSLKLVASEFTPSSPILLQDRLRWIRDLFSASCGAIPARNPSDISQHFIDKCSTLHLIRTRS